MHAERTTPEIYFLKEISAASPPCPSFSALAGSCPSGVQSWNFHELVKEKKIWGGTSRNFLPLATNSQAAHHLQLKREDDGDCEVNPGPTKCQP